MKIKDARLAFVVAHYHAKGKLPLNLFNHIKYLSTITNNIIFVSTNINIHEISKLTPYAKVILRPNFGYDFWSYKLGLEALGDLKVYNRIAFFNSSFVVLDPQLLCKIFLQPVTSPLLRGITLSNQQLPHIQSYWFAFEHPALIQSKAFEKWWGGMVPLSDRNEVITHYELGMSKWFVYCGFKIKPMFKLGVIDQVLSILNSLQYYLRQMLMHDNGISSVIRKHQDVKKNTSHLAGLHFIFKKILRSPRIGQYINPTHHAWKAIYKEFRIIKLELLKTNPTHQNLSYLYTNASQEELSLIDDAVSYHD